MPWLRKQTKNVCNQALDLCRFESKNRMRPFMHMMENTIVVLLFMGHSLLKGVTVEKEIVLERFFFVSLSLRSVQTAYLQRQPYKDDQTQFWPKAPPSPWRGGGPGSSARHTPAWSGISAPLVPGITLTPSSRLQMAKWCPVHSKARIHVVLCLNSSFQK